MTPYHETFLPIFFLGCLIAGILSTIAGMKSGCLLPGFLLPIGVLIVWAAIFVGSDRGYRAWQSMPDPPAEAFNDASVLGALVLGWFPGLVFCSMVFGIVRGFRWLSHWANPEAYPAISTAATAQQAETGNPYQAPNS